MKRLLIFVSLVALSMTPALLAQRGTAETTIDGHSIEIEYGRPSLEGRDMLSRLPVGQTWRMGMNAATMLKTDTALSFDGKTVPAGEHRLTAKLVAQDKWHLLIDVADGAVEVPLENHSVDSPVETYTIWLENKGGDKGYFSMAWGQMKVGTGFTVK